MFNLNLKLPVPLVRRRRQLRGVVVQRHQEREQPPRGAVVGPERAHGRPQRVGGLVVGNTLSDIQRFQARRVCAHAQLAHFRTDLHVLVHERLEIADGQLDGVGQVWVTT